MPRPKQRSSRRAPARVAIALVVPLLLVLLASSDPAGAQLVPPSSTTTTLPEASPATDPSTTTTTVAGAPATTTPAPSSSTTRATIPQVTVVPIRTAPAADARARAQADADLNEAKRLLTEVIKAENSVITALNGLDAQVAKVEQKRASLAASEQQAATDLEASRAKLRAVVVARYEAGGDQAFANQLLRVTDIDTFGRAKQYANAALDGQKRVLATYKDALGKATGAAGAVGKEADSLRTRRPQVAQQLADLTALRTAREADVAAKQQLSDLITLAAPVEPSDIPLLFLNAYVRGAAAANRRNPACAIHWSAVAAIGRVESGHGRSGGASVSIGGDVSPRILGPPLDGNGFAYIGDTDGGLLDGDPVVDRAVGPMQFIPSTWKFAGQDGNGDGFADPNNAYDAAQATAMYLCRARTGLDQEQNLQVAAYSYNHSDSYVAKVLAIARSYIDMNLPGVPPGPPRSAPPPVTPGPPATAGGAAAPQP